jgi:thiosulfate/3-mercaptopyruvate sulfurtransferase
MDSSPLVSTAWLEDHLADPDLRIIEVCSVRDDKIYREGHIPGAMWVYWKSACWHETDRDFITPAALAKMLGGMGIGPQSTVVLYGDPVQYGSYAFWAFTMAGHAKLRLLDGGRRKWVMEGRPLSQTVPHFPAIAYPAPEGTSSMRVGRRDVRDKLGQPRRLLLDFRSPEEYSGKRVSDYSFQSPDQLRVVLAGAGVIPEKFDDVVCYCRLSHRATIGWIALSQILAHTNVKIYDGSWTEWGSIVGYPIEK